MLYLLDLQDDWGLFYDPRLHVWGTDMEDLKRVGNQWVADDVDVKRFYFIRLLKPEGLTEIIYSSTD